MVKQRKRTNSNLPAKGRLRDIADRLWSKAIAADWGHRCAVCGKGKTEAHHLIPRQNYRFRYDLTNGIALCAQHHKFDTDIAPHQNAAGWLSWLDEYCLWRAEWLTDNCRRQFTGTTNAAFFCDTILRLRQYFEADEFERIVGVKLTAYLTQEYTA